MTNEKDKELAKQYLKRWGADNHITMYTGLDALVETFAGALTTIRKEEREAAFRSAAGIARMMAAGETHETGRQKALNIAAALEAAATAKKEGNDGPS